MLPPACFTFAAGFHHHSLPASSAHCYQTGGSGDRDAGRLAPCHCRLSAPWFCTAVADYQHSARLNLGAQTGIIRMDKIQPPGCRYKLPTIRRRCTTPPRAHLPLSTSNYNHDLTAYRQNMQAGAAPPARRRLGTRAACQPTIMLSQKGPERKAKDGGLYKVARQVHALFTSTVSANLVQVPYTALSGLLWHKQTGQVWPAWADHAANISFH